MPKILFAWSGGKDSAIALWEIMKKPEYTLTALLTTMTENYDRISMHGVRNSLLEKQANSIGLPLTKVYISKKSSNEEYESKMKEKLVYYKSTGVTSVAFGDIFLEDLRKYRENNLSQIQIDAVFPIWKRNTLELANCFIENGFKAIVTCIDTNHLDKSFLSDLPAKVDPCGENGEFHTFVYNGPIFKYPLTVKKGKVVLREKRFYFCDII
ncbi:MAG: diphthine--ammonia ligase [Elusimicrobia bacterium]|nr:diphthine--ammonia ligase [Elusimicrobiota bacterium]MBU2614957.1 diphthine--ammonia ligase [Elusimicrobiota bacterium]